MPSSRTLTIVTAAAICGATHVAQTLASCPFVSSSFTCTTSTNKFYDSYCACFKCHDVNGVGTYQCMNNNDGTVCSGNYGSNGAQSESSTPPGSVDTYLAIGAVFCAVGAVLLALLKLVAHCFRADKATTVKTSPDTKTNPCMIAYKKAHGLMFGAMYKNEGTQILTLGESWIAGNELLNCFWCCCRKKSEEDWRPFGYRFARLLASLSIGAALGMMFGSLEFDDVVCTETRDLTYCNTRYSTINLNQISSVCESGPGILSSDSLLSAASWVSTGSTQLVKYIGSFAQDVGKPRTWLDVFAHTIWLLAALAAFPICYFASTSLFSSDDNDQKDAGLRMQLIVGVTVASWIQDQGLDLVKVPIIYLAKRAVMPCVPHPNTLEKIQIVQPAGRELTQPKYAPGPKTTNDDGKANAIASPTPAK